MNDDLGHLSDDDYQFKYFLQAMWSYLKIYKHAGSWIGGLLFEVPFAVWFLDFLSKYEWYLNDGAWLKLMGNAVEVSTFILVWVIGASIGYYAEQKIRRTK